MRSSAQGRSSPPRCDIIVPLEGIQGQLSCTHKAALGALAAAIQGHLENLKMQKGS